MKKGLSLKNYVDDVLLQLGSSVVTVEIEEDVPRIVELAFNELKNYITDIETMTLPYAQTISLEGKNVSNVIYVIRGHNNSGPGGFQDIMYIYSRQSALNTYTLTDYARALLAQQNKNALATDMDFYYDKRNEMLYLYAQQALPSTITLAYTMEYDNVEQIIEPHWQNLLKRLSVAMTKEVLGRVRGKYTLNSATYNLDADTLLSEAQSELTTIREYLHSNSDMLLPMD